MGNPRETKSWKFPELYDVENPPVLMLTERGKTRGIGHECTPRLRPVKEQSIDLLIYFCNDSRHRLTM
jgi:hypothetical protein